LKRADQPLKLITLCSKSIFAFAVEITIGEGACEVKVKF
jgi:hypothetical protein